MRHIRGVWYSSHRRPQERGGSRGGLRGDLPQGPLLYLSVPPQAYPMAGRRACAGRIRDSR